MAKTIIVYSTPTCVYCKMAKDYFKTVGLSYTEYNVAEDDAKRDEMVQKSGQLGVPVLDIDGTILVGFNKAEVEKALQA